MAQHLFSKKSFTPDPKPWGLLASIIVITLLHYKATAGYPLLHEISQRLYYLPIIYAAYSYGLRGGLATSVLSALIYRMQKYGLQRTEVAN